MNLGQREEMDAMVQHSECLFTCKIVFKNSSETLLPRMILADSTTIGAFCVLHWCVFWQHQLACMLQFKKNVHLRILFFLQGENKHLDQISIVNFFIELDHSSFSGIAKYCMTSEPYHLHFSHLAYAFIQSDLQCIHLHWWHTAHQEQLGVQCLAQGRFDRESN